MFFSLWSLQKEALYLTAKIFPQSKLALARQVYPASKYLFLPGVLLTSERQSEQPG